MPIAPKRHIAHTLLIIATLTLVACKTTEPVADSRSKVPSPVSEVSRIMIDGFRLQMTARLVSAQVKNKGYEIRPQFSTATLDDLIQNNIQRNYAGGFLSFERTVDDIYYQMNLSFDEYAKVEGVNLICWFMGEEERERRTKHFLEELPSLELYRETEEHKIYSKRYTSLSHAVLKLDKDSFLNSFSISISDNSYALIRSRAEGYRY